MNSTYSKQSLNCSLLSVYIIRCELKKILIKKDAMGHRIFSKDLWKIHYMWQSGMKYICKIIALKIGSCDLVIIFLCPRSTLMASTAESLPTRFYKNSIKIVYCTVLTGSAQLGLVGQREDIQLVERCQNCSVSRSA